MRIPKLLAARAPHPSSLRDATFPWKGKVQCCAHFQRYAMPIAQNKLLAARAPHPTRFAGHLPLKGEGAVLRALPKLRDTNRTNQATCSTSTSSVIPSGYPLPMEGAVLRALPKLRDTNRPRGRVSPLSPWRMITKSPPAPASAYPPQPASRRPWVGSSSDSVWEAGSL